jgi:hypothetical protein
VAGTYLRRPLSGSTDGRGIKVVQTGTAGTLIHTAQASATLIDSITLDRVYNSHTATVTLTLECGGATVPDDLNKFDIPSGMTVPIVADLLLRNGLVLRAWAGTANVITIHGFVLIES